MTLPRPYQPDLETVAGRVRAARAFMSASLADFALLAETTVDRLVAWESGLAVPNARELASLVKAGADLNYIVLGWHGGELLASEVPLNSSEQCQALAHLIRRQLHRYHPKDGCDLLIELLAEEFDAADVLTERLQALLAELAMVL